MAIINIAEAQLCSGSWALQRPLTVGCVSGQWIGWQNPGPPPVGCPINPSYLGTETNTFTFSSPVTDFIIDFYGFDGASQCARLSLKVNGIFFPITKANFVDFPPGNTCTGSFSVMMVTPDGYLVSTSSAGGGQGRIILSGVNATSVSVCTNDGAGTVFTNPFNCINVVPINLESFSGNSSPDCKAVLNWKTGIEQNVREIEIQRSENAILFYKVGNVPSKGNYSSYSYSCANSTNGYFRLRIIDLDSHYEFSDVLNVKSNCNSVAFRVFPNPANSEIEIIGLKDNDKVQIVDMLGRIISTFNPSQNNNKFDIKNLIRGMYVLQIINSNIKSNIKFIKE